MKYCLVGERLSLSYSPLIHNLAGIDYDLKEVSGKDFSQFVLSGEYDGYNVTMPFKRKIMPYLDAVSDVAKNCNAVNTVLKKDGKLYGYNTDFYGMKFMAERAGVTLKDKNVLILGGGATKDTAAYLATVSGAKSVKFVSRKGVINYENCYALAKDTQIIINATPVGSYGFETEKIIELERFENVEAVLDCVYNPYNTPLLLDAKRLKLKCGHGIDMLVFQALRSEEIWLDKKHTQSFVDKILQKTKEKTLNLILTGMPSCGKTFIGGATAEKLNKQFFDTDKIIEKSENAPCPKIIKEKGEGYFRKVENDAVKSLSSVRGAVVATGGGTVLDEENVKALRANGVVVYIRRDLSLLESTFRPLSESVGIKELYERRRGIYESTCDYAVSNDGDVETCVKGVIKLYEDSCR